MIFLKRMVTFAGGHFLFNSIGSHLDINIFDVLMKKNGEGYPLF